MYTRISKLSPLNIRFNRRQHIKVALFKPLIFTPSHPSQFSPLLIDFQFYPQANYQKECLFLSIA